MIMLIVILVSRICLYRSARSRWGSVWSRLSGWLRLVCCGRVGRGRACWCSRY